MIIALLTSLLMLAADPHAISGTVRDASGAAVVGAAVVLRTADGADERTTSGPDGRFLLDVPATAAAVAVTVRAEGFAEARQTVAVATSSQELTIVLMPASLIEAVTVTGTRGVGGTDAPAATSVLTAEALASTPAPALDDQLKAIPGFSLFRRSSSRVANPTTQGVTMRGLSASGASRSLVLVDGVPLNDPFGGWVYWDRVPQAALDRVEVVRGGTSDLYGADAVGGVIQILTKSPSAMMARASAEMASRGTPRLSMYGGTAGGAWTAFGSGEWQRTDGYVIVAPQTNAASPNPNLRGPVDVAATSDYRTLYAGAGYQSSSWRAAWRANLFHESRGNGTPLTNNDTTTRLVSGETSGALGRGLWLVRAYGGTEDYNQSFSSVSTVASLRVSESLTQRQHVPSRQTGASAQWSASTRLLAWTAGIDTKRTSGTSEETAFTRGVATGTTSNGGIQWDTGAFARVSVAPLANLTLSASLRADRWSSDPENASASSQQTTEISPKAGVTWRVSDGLVFHGMATHAFRAPTLNELFRNFRAGGTFTTANDALHPEALTSVEGGVTVTHGPVAVRAIGFWNELSNAVTNVTVSATQTLITRQRQNAGTTRAAGAELEADWRAAPRLHVTAGVELVDSIFAQSQEPGLAGNRVAQVPTASGTASVRVDVPGGLLAVGQFRASSSQFDDDRNTLPLDGFSVLDASVSRSIGPRLQLFAAVENIFDRQYDVGNTPLLTVGLPRTGRAGLRFAFR